jgi:hypothetical protein
VYVQYIADRRNIRVNGLLLFVIQWRRIASCNDILGTGLYKMHFRA